MNDSEREKRHPQTACAKGLFLKKWLVLLFGVCCIAASAVFVRQAGVNGLVSAFYRVAIALAVVAPVFAFSKKRRMKTKSVLACVCAGVLFGFELAFWNLSITMSNATMPTLLVNMSSVWVGIGAFFALKEKVGAYHWIGNVVSIVGLAIIVGIGPILALTVDAGIVLALVASVFLAGYTLLVKTARGEMQTVSVLFFALIGSMLPLSAACIAFDLPLTGYSTQTWISFLCLGVITQVGGYFSINYSLGHIPSVKVSLITLLQPVLTAAFAFVALGEVIGTNKIVGGIVTIAGLGVSFLGKRKAVVRASPD